MLPRPEPLSSEDVELEERRKRRALALVSTVERGIALALDRRTELEEALEDVRARLGRLLDDELAQAVFVRLAAELRDRLPYSVGHVVKCRQCGQVGEARELVMARLRWRWTGQDEHGASVHPVRVVQARDVGDVPPGLCPDHEAEAIRRQLLPKRPVMTLERRERR